MNEVGRLTRVFYVIYALFVQKSDQFSVNARLVRCCPCRSHLSCYSVEVTVKPFSPALVLFHWRCAFVT